MIPITLSFFLNKPGALRQALLFCLGIIVMFTALGLLVTAVLGPFGVVQLGSNPWVNSFIAIVFIVFGLSLLGAFEITLPSSLLTKMDQASQRGGSIGTLLMGLTFSLTSFACVGPFIGTLLAGSVQRGGIQPALGMMTFASGLASPFFLLALFPAFLQRMPRSGGWLARVKVVLGFIILAISLKYLSSIDQVLQWNVITRERFLAVWIVMFALPGLYLLGFLRMEGVRQDEKLGVARTLTGAAFLIFAISLIPGMFGAPLGELDSYVPLAKESVGRGSANRANLDQERSGWRARQSESREQASFRRVHRLCLHELPLDEGKHVSAAGDRRRIIRTSSWLSFTPTARTLRVTKTRSSRNQRSRPSRFLSTRSSKAIAAPVAKFAGLTRSTSEFLAFLRTQ